MDVYSCLAEIPAGSFELMRGFAAESCCESEYYFSILDKRQKGRVFADDPYDPRAVLFWHYSGYGFAAGRPDAAFIGQLIMMIRREHPAFTGDVSLQKRFILQQDSPPDWGLEAAGGILRSERLCFELDDSARRTPSLPDEYGIKPVDAAILRLMTGSVTPAFSWSSDEEFLRRGAGRCVMRGGEPAAWAFSAAIGNGRMDIGVETAPQYRGMGLARAAAAAMAAAALEMGLTPVWGCDIGNIASAKTAESSGFRLTGRHGKYKAG